MSTNQTKKEYDKRTHEERISDLQSAFDELKVDAIISGVKTKASARQVLLKANVNKTYFYTDKIKDASVQKKYHDMRDKINAFQDNFDTEHAHDSALEQAQILTQKESERAAKAERLLVDSREQVASLKNKISELNKKLQDGDLRSIDSAHQSMLMRQASANNVANFTSVKVISPDLYITVDGKYRFDDETLKSEAWERSERELHELLQRPLPMRVYILIGPPCSGKTTWRSDDRSFMHDRHPIVIDSTNLTQYERMRWMMIVQQYVRTQDVKSCAVVFHTPTDILLSRNNQREISKKLDEKTLLQKVKTMTWPDLKDEKFDEMVVMRHG